MNKKDNLYMDLADRIGQMSYAERKKVGAVIVKDDNILAYGYNGTPRGADNCCEENTYLDHGDTVPMMQKTKREVLHAESNAISKIARSTSSSDGASLYVTLSPCFECAKLIIQSGIERVVFKEEYRDLSGLELLKQNGVWVHKI